MIMHKLSRHIVNDGIKGFVEIVEEPENSYRELSIKNKDLIAYRYKYHQDASGLPVEVELKKIVTGVESKALRESTEIHDEREKLVKEKK